MNEVLVIDNAALKRYAAITRELIFPLIKQLSMYELSSIEVQLIMSSMLCIMDKFTTDATEEKEQRIDG